MTGLEFLENVSPLVGASPSSLQITHHTLLTNIFSLWMRSACMQIGFACKINKQTNCYRGLLSHSQDLLSHICQVTDSKQSAMCTPVKDTRPAQINSVDGSLACPDNLITKTQKSLLPFSLLPLILTSADGVRAEKLRVPP